MLMRQNKNHVETLYSQMQHIHYNIYSNWNGTSIEVWVHNKICYHKSISIHMYIYICNYVCIYIYAITYNYVYAVCLSCIIYKYINIQNIRINMMPQTKAFLWCNKCQKFRGWSPLPLQPLVRLTACFSLMPMPGNSPYDQSVFPASFHHRTHLESAATCKHAKSCKNCITVTSAAP